MLDTAWWVDSFPRWLALGGGAGGSFVLIKWVLEQLLGRVQQRESAIDAGTQRLIEGLERRLTQESHRYDELEMRLEAFRHDLDECRKKHLESESEVIRLKAMVAGLGDARQHAQLIISAERKSDASSK